MTMAFSSSLVAKTSTRKHERYLPPHAFKLKGFVSAETQFWGIADIAQMVVHSQSGKEDPK